MCGHEIYNYLISDPKWLKHTIKTSTMFSTLDTLLLGTRITTIDKINRSISRNIIKIFKMLKKRFRNLLPLTKPSTAMRINLIKMKSYFQKKMIRLLATHRLKLFRK